VNQAKGKVKVGSSRCLLAIGLIGSLAVRSYDPKRLQDVLVHPHPRRDRKRRWFDGGEAITSVFTNHGGKPNLRLVDIDRVEVLRGPQGGLFGADVLAGVMRIIPAATI